MTGSATVAITPGPVSSLDLSAPSTATAGSSFVATVTALDAYGNTATSYRGTVHFTSTDSGAQTSLPDDYTFTAGDAGTHGFPVTLTSAGNRTVTVADGTRTASTPVAVEAGGATHLVIAGPDAAVTAGDAFDVTVSVEDAFGNPVPSFAGTVHLTSSDPDASLPADYAFTPGDAGSHTFGDGATLTTAGSQSIGVADTADGFDPASTPVTVTPAAPDHVAAPGPTGAVAGQAEPLTFQVQDRFGNVVTTSSAAVSFTCTGVGDAPGTCPAPTSFSSGQVTVSPVLTLAGTQTVTASSAGITSGVAALSVSARAGLRRRARRTGRAGGAPGTSFGVTATIYDAFGNLEAGDTGRMVTLSAASPVAPFPLSAATNHGVATFSGITVTVAGGYVLTGASAGLSDGATGLTVAARRDDRPPRGDLGAVGGGAGRHAVLHRRLGPGPVRQHRRDRLGAGAAVGHPGRAGAAGHGRDVRRHGVLRAVHADRPRPVRVRCVVGRARHRERDRDGRGGRSRRPSW